MGSKVAGIVFIIGSLYYIVSEAIPATFFNASLFNTYFFHTISELGIPNVSSPLSWLMNSAFILMGLTLLFGNLYKFKDFLTKNKIAVYILTLITAIGVIIVGFIYGGNPFTLGYHMMGAMMAILGGNILLVVISRSMNEFSKYQMISLILGVLGLISFWIMFFNMNSIYMPIFERLSVYTMIIWCFLTGIFVYSNKSIVY